MFDAPSRLASLGTAVVAKCIGKYELDKVVGRGGLGVVYRAVDRRSGEEVALKLLRPPGDDNVVLRRLAREFHALRSLQHRNIVRVIDAGQTDDAVPYIAMELVRGLPLRGYLDVSTDEREWWLPLGSAESPSSDSVDARLAWLSADTEPDSIPPAARKKARRAPEPLSARERARLNHPERLRRLCDVLGQLCDGLAFIHARKLVHRDIKPANVIVCDDGCVKLVDFGLVKPTSDDGMTAAGRVVGTYQYMSPEQAKGEDVDGRSDLYAVGGVLYEMIAGRPPISSESPTGLLHAIVHESPVDPRVHNPDVPPALAQLAMRLLEKNPAHRLQSAAEVARALRDSTPL